jgi:hypothetical protein
MLFFGRFCDFGCLEAAIHDRRQRVSIGRKVMSVGVLISVISLARSQVIIRRAYIAHPRETQKVLSRLGYAGKSVEASLFIVGYQYAVLRRPFQEMSGPSLERELNALLFWLALMFIGIAVGLAGVAIQLAEARAL